MFSLKPAAQDSFVCLRCQCRLSLRQRPRSGPIGYPPQRHPHFTSGPSLRQEQSPSYDAVTDNGNFARAPIRYYTEELHPNQNYRHGNEPSAKDSLGLNVLGEPAEVLILRDKENQFRIDSPLVRVRASRPDTNPAQESISSSEMLEKMNAERGIIDIDEVCKNMDSLRASWAPGTEGSITSAAYNGFASRLQEGFTKQQLRAYLDRAGKNPAADVFDLNVEISNRIYARSSWQAVGDTPTKKSEAPKIADNAPEAKFKETEVLEKERGQGLSKEALVKRILRQCWNITPRVQGSSLGELDIRLQKLHLDLILNHKRDILKLISRSYDSKVEAWPQEQIIRISSDYESCVDILKLVMHTLENIQSSTINLKADSMLPRGSTPSPRELSNAMLRKIEEYTNTLVRPQSSRKKLRVFYLGPDDADLLETRRLIHQILRPASAQNLGLAGSKGDKSSNASPVPVVVGSRLSLLDRNQQWSRWCSPYTQISIVKRSEKHEAVPSSSTADPVLRAMHGRLAIRTVKSFFEAPDYTSNELWSNDAPYWRPTIEYHDSVKLGQVLFPAKKAALVAEALEQNPRRKTKKTGHKIRSNDTRDIGDKSVKQPREFLPLVPGLVRSLESLGPLEKSEEFVQVRLSPSSNNVSLPVPVEALPDLEIRIAFHHETTTTSIRDIRLVNRKEKDFMQPQNIVDLRFVRDQCVYARDDSIDPRIASFVQDCNFDIGGTERLKTPLGLSLSIPALAVQPHNGFDPKSNETLLVDYTSLSLEHRSSLTMPYLEPHSWPTLTYTIIEAGPIGGRRDEISLHNTRFASKQLSPLDRDSSAVSIHEESLLEDHHTSTLFQKTAALIESIEQAGREESEKGLSMPEVRRWRSIRGRKIKRRVWSSSR